MKYLLTLVIILSPLGCFSQDWEILNPAYKYNFRTSNSDLISSTVWIDSMQTSGEDSIFYLNRIVTDCDTCQLKINGYPLAIYDSPQFLQRIVIKSDSAYRFKSPGNFTIKPKANLNEHWVFDTLNNIFAEVLLLERTDVFDKADSIKIIGLSTGDTIILSKNYGLIRFDPIYDEFGYSLAGIDGQIGESVPGFYDFFNFSVGDIFEYHGDYSDHETRRRIFIEKVYINEKIPVGDNLQYNITIHRYSREAEIPPFLWYDPEYAKSGIITTTWKFIESPGHPTNYYNNELVDLDAYEGGIWCFDRDIYSYSKLHASKDSSGLYTKTVGSFALRDFYKIQDPVNKILSRFDDVCNEQEEIYKVGLGEVFHENFGFEWGESRQLKAYRKGNDTVGVFTDDEKFILGVNDFENVQISIYPNPAQERITISIPDDRSIINVSILGLDGHIYKTGIKTSTLSVGGMEPGIYILKVELNKGIVYNKIVINAP